MLTRSSRLLMSSGPAMPAASNLRLNSGTGRSKTLRTTSLVRMLAMRRTMFVEPLELVPIVQWGASHAVAQRERVRLVKFLGDAGIARDPGPWLRKVEKAALRALAARGEATAGELAGDVP